jgi:hypothetical protein
MCFSFGRADGAGEHGQQTPLSQLDVQKSDVRPLCTCTCVAAENRTSSIPRFGKGPRSVGPFHKKFSHFYKSK